MYFGVVVESFQEDVPRLKFHDSFSEFEVKAI